MDDKGEEHFNLVMSFLEVAFDKGAREHGFDSQDYLSVMSSIVVVTARLVLGKSREDFLLVMKELWEGADPAKMGVPIIGPPLGERPDKESN